MATILITGVTGMVGSVLASLLKSKGCRLICLIRPKSGQDPMDRLSQALGQLTGSEVVWKGDVTLPHIGISDGERQRWKGRINKIVHCAASIKFDEASADATTKVNVDGTNNILKLAEELKIPEIHHISTAYVAGDADYFSENDFDIGQTCCNVYERTKKESEQLVRDWQFGRYSIYRLSVIIGDSITGYTPSFYGYYGFLSAFWHLKQTLARKSKSEIKKYEAEGIGFDSEGTLRIPICINISPTSTLNLVPIDWIARTTSELIEVSATGKTFHIVHPCSPKSRWVNDVSLKHLGIKGFCYREHPDYNPQSLLGKLQRIFDRNAVEYIPYVTRRPKFGVVNTSRVLGPKYTSPPNIDEAFVARLMDYAKSVNFGKKEERHKAVGV